MKDWKVYLEGYLSGPVIQFIHNHFEENGLEPEIAHIIGIPESDIQDSNLSITFSKELMLFQQQNRRNAG